MTLSALVTTVPVVTHMRYYCGVNVYLLLESMYAPQGHFLPLVRAHYHGHRGNEEAQ